MRRNRLFALAVAALLLAQVISAQTKDNASEGSSSLWTTIKNAITYPARKFVQAAFAPMINGLTHNPTFFCVPNDPQYAAFYDPSCKVTKGIDILMNKWMTIMIPFYVVAILFTAIFWLLKAGTPRGRARARAMFLKLILGMVFVALAPVIYQMLLEFSVILVKFFLYEYSSTLDFGLFQVPLDMSLFGNVNDQMDSIATRIMYSGMNMSCLFVFITLAAMVIASIFIWVRNMMVFFYGIFFPVILFFYSFEITKPDGQKWLNASLKWIFTPALQALILGFVVVISNRMSLLKFGPTVGATLMALVSNSMGGMIVLAGLYAFAFAPMIVGQMMSWLGNAISAVGLGSGRQWMVAVGGIMAGGGSGAMIQADAEYSRANSYERYQSTFSNTTTGSVGTAGGMMGATGGGGGGGSLMGRSGGAAGGGGAAAGGGGASGGAAGGAAGGGAGPAAGAARGAAGGGSMFPFQADGTQTGTSPGAPAAGQGGPDEAPTAQAKKDDQLYGGYGQDKPATEALTSDFNKTLQDELEGKGGASPDSAASAVTPYDAIKSELGQAGPKIIREGSSEQSQQSNTASSGHKSRALGGTSSGGGDLPTEDRDMAYDGAGKGPGMKAPTMGAAKAEGSGGGGGGNPEADAERRKADAVANFETDDQARRARIDSLNRKKARSGLTRQEEDMLARLTEIEERQRRQSGYMESQAAHQRGDSEDKKKRDLARKKDEQER
jgi:hypothetical protein